MKMKTQHTKILYLPNEQGLGINLKHQIPLFKRKKCQINNLNYFKILKRNNKLI
jgi:hypothetical protein